jgi:hypothetical protein
MIDIPHIPPDIEKLVVQFHGKEISLKIPGLCLALIEEHHRLQELGHFWEHQPRVLVGWKTFYRLGEAIHDSDAALHLSMNVDVSYMGKYRKGYLSGFTIYMVPWFEEGMMFLPENLEEDLFPKRHQ